MTTKTQTTGSVKQNEGSAVLENIHRHPPIFHLGKQKPKNVKKLKKGKGKAMDKVHMALNQLQPDSEEVHYPLIISYEEKPRKKRKKKRKVNFMGMKIDRKKLKKQLKKSGIKSSYL